MAADPISDYVAELDREFATGLATEHTYRPALKGLVEALRPKATAVNEAKRVACGAPDFTVVETAGHGPLTLGYIEAKDIGVSLDDEEQSPQLTRYLAALPNLILTDYIEFRWYVNGDKRATASLGVPASGKVKLSSSGEANVEALLASFLGHGPEKIKSPSRLAERMARLAHLMRDMVIADFASGSATKTTVELKQAFTEVLLPDLTVDQFADMFAQTLAYGLFAARANHQGPAPFTRASAAAEIPKTNPFLRKLFATVTGQDLDDAPYAGIADDLAHLLAYTDMDAVLSSFGSRTRRVDPVIHFYETFLEAYDPKLREVRGVYFTPEPVVDYIVSSVDSLLKTEFGLADGLRDTSASTYSPVEKDGEGPAQGPSALILDPATGTGTFLYAIVDRIREHFIAQGEAGKWQAYVKEQLLPRLFGFELLMAPYAVAHLKLGLQLAARDLPEDDRTEWEYNLNDSERLGIYLTNTLEEALMKSELLLGSYISDEANAAADVKRRLPIMVVLGNPPYSGHSANRSQKVRERTTKKGRVVNVTEKTFIGRLLDDYYKVDGEPLRERTTKWLQDDYTKFIRFGQWRVERSGRGILAFITNHGYLDNPTFRGMRSELLRAFSEIYIIDLHGNFRKREKTDSGGPDGNVFDIEQGVAIGLFILRPGVEGRARVFHRDVRGSRAEKYDWLSANDVKSTNWEELQPQKPYYLFKPQASDLWAEYESAWSLAEAMPLHGTGMTTARNEVVIDFEQGPLRDRATLFRDSPKPDDSVCKDLGIREKKGWEVAKARQLLKAEKGDLQRFIEPVSHLPFDERWIFYHDSLVWRTGRRVMRHMIAGGNIGILTTRQTRDQWDALVTTNIVTHKALSAYDITSLFPLWIHPADNDEGTLQLGLPPTPNFAPEFLNAVASTVAEEYIPSGLSSMGSFGPEDLFAYIYAILQSPGYRARYAEFLARDFPRIPLTADPIQFHELIACGHKLMRIHKLDPSELTATVRFPVKGSSQVSATRFPTHVSAGDLASGEDIPSSEGRVFINPTQWFEGVSDEVWAYWVGGYRPAEHWLKQRRGRTLTYTDLEHYTRIVQALEATAETTAELDKLVPAWPLD